MTREENIKWLESLKAEIGKSEHRPLWHYAEAIDMAIEALQAEPVVRCKDCRHNEWCIPKQGRSENDYCSRGERREDG